MTLSVGHMDTDSGAVDRSRTGIWKAEFLRRGIDVTNIEREYGSINVAYVSHPTTKERHQKAVRLKAMGLPIVMGVDDDYSEIHEDNSAYLPTKEAESYRWITETAKVADAVVVTTKALQDKFKGYCDHVVIVPNYIEDKRVIPMLGKNLRANKGRFGWAGSLRNHPEDIDFLKYAIRDLCNKYSFHHIGQGALSKKVDAPVYEHGETSFEGYFQTMFDNFDVGLAPLEKSVFNLSKSKLKILELSATGIPWVASPSPAYLKVVNAGVGIVAQKPSQWVQQIDRLLSDPDYYNEHMQRNHEWAQTQVISKNYTDWVDLFESVR